MKLLRTQILSTAQQIMQLLFDRRESCNVHWASHIEGGPERIEASHKIKPVVVTIHRSVDLPMAASSPSNSLYSTNLANGSPSESSSNHWSHIHIGDDFPMPTNDDWSGELSHIPELDISFLSVEILAEPPLDAPNTFDFIQRGYSLRAPMIRGVNPEPSFE